MENLPSWYQTLLCNILVLGGGKFVSKHGCVTKLLVFRGISKLQTKFFEGLSLISISVHLHRPVKLSMDYKFEN